jgi:hypothetical protein
MYFSLMSLNRKTQSKQCDFHVHLWDEDKVGMRFYDSKCMGHWTLKRSIRRAPKIYQGKHGSDLLDGPNVNRSFYSKVEKTLLDFNVHLINIGSCRLHIVQGAFQKGVEETEWKADSVLHAMYSEGRGGGI